ncbi:hypothetical protein CPC08DRAFT_216582 [Agrocybe pediades]|nr:hypothetical protein CPC08DRAFT_216582 [Agrocybe pediades]
MTAKLLHVLWVMRLVTCFDVAASSIFIWDYFMTLGMEIELVWSSRWTFMKVVFLIQRYLPFFDTIGLVLSHQLLHGLSPDTCQNLYRVSAVAIVLGFFFSEIILTVRAWAVLNAQCMPWISKILPFFFVGWWSLDLYFVSSFLKSLQIGPPPFPSFAGCFVTGANESLILCWTIVLIWDALVLLMMVVPGLEAYRSGGETALLDIVYREGMVYYLYLFILSVVNIVIVKLLPAEYQNLFTSTERVIHSILASRVLLHIRCYAARRNENWHEEISMIEWAHVGV